MATPIPLPPSHPLFTCCPPGALRARATSAASNLRRTESVVGLSEPDRALLRVLDGAVEGLEPPLEEQVGAACVCVCVCVCECVFVCVCVC